VSEKVRMR
jgi:hypothetical protein